MPITKVTGDVELDAIISQLHKNFGRDNLVSLGIKRDQLKSITTGSLGLDIAIGLGGLPIGRVIEIFGPESSGKTSLALFMAAQYNEHKASIGHDNRFILIVDLEHTITLDLLEGVGLDTSTVIFVQPNTAEEAFQTILDLTKSNKIGFMILDSVDAAQSEAQLRKNIGENEMGGISKILSRTLREYSKLCSETETTAIFINQIRHNPGQMFGSQLAQI